MNNIIFDSHSTAEYAWLLFMICMVVAVLVAWTIIVRRAGFSAAWLLPPYAGGGLTCALWLLLFFDTTTVYFGGVALQVPKTPSDFEAISWSILILSLMSLVEFFVFAIVHWPVQSAAESGRYERWRAKSMESMLLTQRRDLPTVATAPLVGAAAAGVDRPLGSDMPAYASRAGVPMPPPPTSGPSGGVGVVAPPMAPAVTTFYCSWCGKERRSDTLAIHHCGSRERPAVFCSGCGNGLERDAEFCDRCGTPASELSPG